MVLTSMDTEYDRECAWALLSADSSRAEIYELELKPADNHVTEVVNEYENAKLIPADRLNLRLRERRKKLAKKLKEARRSFSGLRAEVLKLQSRIEDKLRSPRYYIIISTYDQS